jgi:hypothetical protein
MRKKFDTKADQEQTWQGFLGDQFGNIVVPKMANYVYITLTDGTTSIALNKSVPAIVNLPITVGYDPQQAGGKVLEVLAVRNIPRTSAKDSSYHVDGHRASHEWMNPDGGTDVVYTQLRQFMPLRPQTVSGSAFSIYVYPAIQNIGGSWQQVGNVSIDLTSYRPGTQTFVVSGSSLPAVYVLISMNNISGSMIVTSGSAMTIGTLTLANIPVTPANNVPICAVRLYALQTLIQEDRLSTDLVDMRWGLPFTGAQTVPVNTPPVVGYYLTGYSGSSGAFTSGSVSSAVSEAPNDGKQYGRQSLGWTVITSGSGGTISGSGVITTGVVSNGHLAGFSGSSGNYIYDDEAPQDGNQYARKNAAWVTVTSGSGGSISGSGVITTGAVSDGHLAVFSGSSGNYIKDGGVTPTFEVILKNETLASPAASLIFSSIPTGYSHLRIIISARAVNNDINQASVIFNSDNNVANYFYAETYFGTSTSSAVRSGSDLFAINIAGGNSPTSHFGGGIVDVLEYANTTMTKQAKMDSFARRASSFYGDQQWGYWNSTAAVNRIDITPGSGNFAAGTHWTVIGIKTN